MKKYILFIAFLGLSACATPISPQEIETADYGTPPTGNYEDIIKKEIGAQLFDPYSAVYEIKPPSKGYTRESPVFGTQKAFGYKVCGTVNAKNRMGGYVGSVPFFALFRNGHLIVKQIGETEGGLMTASIMNACSR